MVVERMDDSEADLLRRIRNVVGEKPLVSTSMDLHGNVSRDLAHLTDLITVYVHLWLRVTCKELVNVFLFAFDSYRTAPHVDVIETKERAVRNLVECLTINKPRPFKALVSLPVLLPGGE